MISAYRGAPTTLHCYVPFPHVPCHLRTLHTASHLSRQPRRVVEGQLCGWRQCPALVGQEDGRAGGQRQVGQGLRAACGGRGHGDSSEREWVDCQACVRTCKVRKEHSARHRHSPRACEKEQVRPQGPKALRTARHYAACRVHLNAPEHFKPRLHNGMKHESPPTCATATT